MLRGLIDRVKVLLSQHKTVVQERRKLIRMRCRIMLEAQNDSGQLRQQVVASDLSLVGMRLESKDAFKRGEPVFMGLPGSEKPAVRCKVIWSRKIGRSENFSSGLTFDEDDARLSQSWIKDLLRQVGFGEGRIKERRAHVRVPSRLRCALANRSGDVLTDGSLLNIGLGGALVSVGVEVQVGTKVRLQVDPIAGYPALDLLSTVRSCRKDVHNQKYSHGLRFETQEDPLVVRYLGVLLKLS